MAALGFIAYGALGSSDFLTPGRGGEISIRADERRRIARELHDTTSQSLVAFQLHLARLKGLTNCEIASLVEECEEALREIRDHIRAFDVSD